MNAVEALGVLKFELRIRALEDLAATIMDHRGFLETIVYGDDYEHLDALKTLDAESVLSALKTLDNVDAMCLAEFGIDNQIEGCTSLDDLAQTADTENAKIRKGITDPGK